MKIHGHSEWQTAKLPNLQSLEWLSNTDLVYIADAFEDSSLLTNITISGNCSNLSDLWTFDSLTTLSIACDSNFTIADSAFEGLNNFTTVNISNGCTSIGQDAFKECSSLVSITLPSTVTTIDECAFTKCTSLTSITIPNSVTTIGESAFAECTSLTSITIPNSVTTIGEDAFTDCTSLASITLSNAITTIEDGTFYNCTSLANITLPNSVTTIGYDAFYGTSLTSITIPSSVTTIRENSFPYDLESAYIDSSTIAYNIYNSDSPFYECGLSYLYIKSELYNQYAASGNSDNMFSLESWIIAELVNPNINGYAMYENVEVES